MYNKKSKRSDSYEKAKEKAAEVAATTACLFFGCVDAATTISDSQNNGR
jgi:Ni,Fe-hydrogenase I small subunit